jgi:REP element-mobilizing transposase RayT
MRSRYKITQNDGLHFITSTTIEWIPVFTSDNQFKIFMDSVKFCQKHKNLKVYAYVILENHFHMIVSGNNLSNTIQSLKRYTNSRLLNYQKNRARSGY